VRISRPFAIAYSVIFIFVVLVLNALPARGQAQTIGQWQTITTQMPINPVHLALMHNGKVLVVSGSGNLPSDTNYMAGVFDPATQTITTQPIAWDMFCNGMVVLPDGRPFVMGGTLQYDPFHGETRTSVFDPTTGSFADLETMAHGRWYPTATTLSDGRVMVFSGLTETGGTNTAVEFYTVGSGWSAQFGAPWTPPLYPRFHLLPNGKVFYSGSTTSSHLFDPSTQTWTLNIAKTNFSGTRTYGTSVLLPLTPANGYKPKVIIMGGGNPATATTETIDLSVATPSWTNGPSMSQPRIEMNATILPTGKILALGGSTNDEDTNTASLNADLYDPATNTFSSAGANSFARLYHSNSLLLPDATVLVVGGNPARGTYEPHIEIYSPAYLFNPNGSTATRPTITSVAPAGVGYGTGFQVQTPDAANISSVVLIRAGAVTHAFDMDQRLVGLNFSIANSNTLNVTGPPNSNIAPPGYYLLFILYSSGVPSVAKFVQISNVPADAPPTATITSPTSDVTIQAGGAVLFSGTGSDSDGTISAYSWTFPGGSPSTSALANPGNIIYSTPGTYAATLTVTDNAGLTGFASRTVTVQGAGGGSGPTIDAQASNDTAAASKTIASGAFSTTSSSELLLAFIATDYVSGANTTVTNVTGGGLTWQLVVRTNAQSGSSEIWRAFAPATLTNTTVTATLSQSVVASIAVQSYKGVDTSGTNGSGAIGATASANAASGAPTATLKTTRNNSLVVGVGNDFDNAIARTAGANQTVFHSDLTPTGDTYWMQKQNGTTPLSGTSVTINDTAPTGDRYNLSIAEILPPATVVPTYTLSGQITPTANGSGTTVTLSGGMSASTTSDASGNYSFSGLPNGSYTVTPSKTGFTFTPANQPVTINGANATANFTIAAVPTFSISGAITPAANGSGATVKLTGAATATVTADTSGNYTFSGLANGSYTVTPTKSGFSMTPSSSPATVSNANVTNINFTASVAAASSIAIDATASGDQNSASKTVTSQTFSTAAANELLLAFVSTDDTGSGTVVNSIAGAGLTWTLVVRSNGQSGTSEIWRAFAPTTLTNVSATATLSASVASSITVMSFTGIDTTGTGGSGAIGATKATNAPSGAPTASVVTTRGNSLVVGVGNDFDNPILRTAGASQTLVHQFLPGVGDSYWVQRQNASTPLSGTTVPINDTAPTGDRYNLAICEILAAP
jgi:hypothetical protein